jgi:NAD(P)H-dependent FMN reductase
MPPRIGLIISSVRNPRICPQVANFVLQTIRQNLPTSNHASPTIQQIDLATWKLPIFDEPIIPAQVTDASGYHHEHTRAWSREIASYDAFIFVSPQYNWGYPASLKNAIDYLFNEWVGKPAMIVTYGGFGGGKCAVQLRSVLEGIKMLPTESHVELKYPDMQFAKEKAFPGGGLGLDAESDESVWAPEKPKIVATFGELQKALNNKQKVDRNE